MTNELREFMPLYYQWLADWVEREAERRMIPMSRERIEEWIEELRDFERRNEQERERKHHLDGNEITAGFGASSCSDN